MAELKTSDEVCFEPPLCATCLRHGVNMKAVVECHECKINFCAACIPEHRFSILSGHKIQNLDGSEGQYVPNLGNIPPIDIKEKEISTLISLMSKSTSLEEDTLSAYYVTEINVTTHDDVRKCYVTGCLAMENKELLIVDKNNMKLKLFDVDGNKIVEADTPNVTWGITKLRMNSVATCGSGDQVVIWVIKDAKISILKFVQVHEMAFGLSSNSTLICTMHPHLDSLTFISKQMEIVVNYRRFYDPYGKQLSFGFDLEMDELCVYVGCGLGDKRIVAISIISLTIIWECPLLGNTCGVVELRGQLVVSDMTNKRIEAVSKNGKVLQTLVSLEFMEGRPQYMACNSTGRTLFVSQFGSDVVTVFGVRVQ